MKFPEELRDRAARDRAARDRGEGGRNQGFLGDSNNVPEGVKACQRLSWTSDNRGMGATGCRRSVRMEDTSKGGQPSESQIPFTFRPAAVVGLLKSARLMGRRHPSPGLEWSCCRIPRRMQLPSAVDTPQDLIGAVAVRAGTRISGIRDFQSPTGLACSSSCFRAWGCYDDGNRTDPRPLPKGLVPGRSPRRRDLAFHIPSLRVKGGVVVSRA